MTDTATVLRAARELLSDEARWCRSAIALDGRGRLCKVFDPNAVAWCLQGACVLASRSKDWAAYDLPHLLRPIVAEVSGTPEYADEDSGLDLFVDWHDTYATHADVLQVLDEAIERAAK